VHIDPGVPLIYGVFGGLGGCVSRTVTAPLERIKIIAQTRGSVSMSGELARMYRADGYRGLFVGNGANCMRVFPMAGIVTIVY
jgi:solute carrier family 25 phosphate transporter 23/24/25/41